MIKDGMNYEQTVNALKQTLCEMRDFGFVACNQAERLKEALVLCDRLKCFQPNKPNSAESMEGFKEGFKEGVKMMIELERERIEQL